MFFFFQKLYHHIIISILLFFFKNKLRLSLKEFLNTLDPKKKKKKE